MSNDLNVESAKAAAQSAMTPPAGDVQQLIDEAALRRHAYFRAVGLTKTAPRRLLVTDCKV